MCAEWTAAAEAGGVDDDGDAASGTPLAVAGTPSSAATARPGVVVHGCSGSAAEDDDERAAKPDDEDDRRDGENGAAEGGRGSDADESDALVESIRRLMINDEHC